MTPIEVHRRVREEIDGYSFAAPSADLIGAPWSHDRIRELIADLESVLVAPRLQQLRNVDRPAEPAYDFWAWVVAVEGDFVVFYDPAADDFGLAMTPQDRVPETIGVRGDLIGVFGAR
jgi:hypothetical protein